MSTPSSTRRLPSPLTVVSGAIAVVLIVPLTWLVVEAVTVDPDRAVDLLVSRQTADIVFNSALLMICVTACSILVGVPLAYLTVRTDLPFRRFWSVAVALPLVIPSYVGAFAFVSAFGPQGEFHSLLAPIGINRIPEVYGLSGAVLVITLYTYPYVYLTTRAGLLSFDTRLIEAAQTLNRSRWTAFWTVVFPQIRPSIAAGSLLAALYAVSDFGTPAIMRLPVFTRQIYVEYNAFGSDYAALLSLQLLGLVVLVLLLERLVSTDQPIRGDDTDHTGSRIRLGAWRWPAMLLPVVVTVAAIVLPVWILLLWLGQAGGGARGSVAIDWVQPIEPIGLAVPVQPLNSVGVAIAAAVVAVCVALPVAHLAATSDSPAAGLFERTTYVGFAVPGVILGLALVFFGASYLPWIYQTLPLLVFAYVVRFLPQAVGTIRTSILQVDTRLVEAGRTLGSSPASTFRRITLPLSRSGIIAGAALVFLTTMKELPATLLLRPSGFETIVMQIWQAQEDALYQYAAVPTLVLIVISGASMVVLLSQEGNTGL